MSDQVLIYKDAHFKGASKAFGEGDFDYGELGIGSDELSSAQVPPGMELTLFEHGAWKGASTVLSNDCPWVGHPWNDRTSSIRVRRNPPDPAPKVVIYLDSGYRGSRQCLPVGDCWWSQLTIGNDRVSSVEVPEGMLAILYSDAGFQGRVLGLDRSQPDLAEVDFNDITSSLQIHAESESQFRSCLRGRNPDPSAWDVIRLTGFVKPPENTMPVVAGETLLPFMYVTDAQYPGETQARQWPYYILTREAFWDLAGFNEHSGAFGQTVRVELRTGVSHTSSKTLKETLSMEFSTGGGLSLGSWLSANIGAKLSRELVVEVTDSGTVSEEKTVVREYDFPQGVHCALALWQLKYRYTLTRLSPEGVAGGAVGSWDIAPQGAIEGGFVVEDAYPELPASTNATKRQSIVMGWH